MYTFDLILLRKHYGMDLDIKEALVETHRAEVIEAANAKGSCSMIDYTQAINTIIDEPQPAIDVEREIEAVFGFTETDLSSYSVECNGPCPKRVCK